LLRDEAMSMEETEIRGGRRRCTLSQWSRSTNGNGFRWLWSSS